MSGGLKEIKNRIKSIDNIYQITKAMNMTAAVRIKRTESFFLEFQETREAMQRIASNNLHPYDGDIADRLGYDIIKLWSITNLKEFNKRKGQINLLSYEGRWCYVPTRLQSTMDITRRKEKLYSEFYYSPK